MKHSSTKHKYQFLTDPVKAIEHNWSDNTIPMVSVVCITYNHKQYIRDAIEGFLMQETNFKIEILIGEDCSTDGTREIVFDYKKKYPDLIRVITSDANVGMNANGIRTLNAARGKYIALCEGDDYWTDPLKLQKQVDFLESHSDYCLVYSDFNVLIDKKNQIYHSANRRKNKIIPKGEIFEDLLINNTIATLTVCARANVLKKAADFELFEKKGFISGDLPLWLGMSRYGKIHYIDEPMATYRVLEESAYHSKDPREVLKFVKSTYEQRLYYIEKYGCSEETKIMVDYNYNNMLLKYAFLWRDKKLIEIAYNNLLSNKKLKDKIRLKHKLFYYGSKNIFNWCFVELFRKVKRVFKSY